MPTKTKTVTQSNPAQTLFDKITDELASESGGVKPGKMFGMPCLKVGSKMFAGLWKEDMVFKLMGNDHAVALALKGAKLFDPSGMGRAMKEWVQVPYTHKNKWRALAQAALDYVAGAK